MFSQKNRPRDLYGREITQEKKAILTSLTLFSGLNRDVRQGEMRWPNRAPPPLRQKNSLWIRNKSFAEQIFPPNCVPGTSPSREIFSHTWMWMWREYHGRVEPIHLSRPFSARSSSRQFHGSVILGHLPRSTVPVIQQKLGLLKSQSYTLQHIRGNSYFALKKSQLIFATFGTISKWLQWCPDFFLPLLAHFAAAGLSPSPC